MANKQRVIEILQEAFENLNIVQNINRLELTAIFKFVCQKLNASNAYIDIRILDKVMKLQGIGKDPFDRNSLSLSKQDLLFSERIMDMLLSSCYPKLTECLKDDENEQLQENKYLIKLEENPPEVQLDPKETKLSLLIKLASNRFNYYDVFKTQSLLQEAALLLYSTSVEEVFSVQGITEDYRYLATIALKELSKFFNDKYKQADPRIKKEEMLAAIAETIQSQKFQTQEFQGKQQQMQQQIIKTPQKLEKQELALEDLQNSSLIQKQQLQQQAQQQKAHQYQQKQNESNQISKSPYRSQIDYDQYTLKYRINNLEAEVRRSRFRPTQPRMQNLQTHSHTTKCNSPLCLVCKKYQF